MSGLALTHRWNWPRLGIGGVLGFVAGVLFLAGAIHICAILLVPVFAEEDGWSRLAPYAGQEEFAEVPVATDQSDGVAGLDPLFVNGACHIQLGDAPASVTVDATDRLWSLALYDPKGVIVFSLNDRTAVAGGLDMIVANAAENAALKKAPTVATETTIVAESTADDLIALLRLYAPTRIARDEARQALADAQCAPAPNVIPQAPSGG